MPVNVGATGRYRSEKSAREGPIPVLSPTWRSSGCPSPRPGAIPSSAGRQDFNQNEISLPGPSARPSVHPLPAARRHSVHGRVQRPLGTAAVPPYAPQHRTTVLPQCSTQSRGQWTRDANKARQTGSMRYTPAVRRAGFTEQLAARYRQEKQNETKRNKTKRNETKRNKTKGYTKVPVIGFPVLALCRRGPSQPSRAGTVRTGWAWRARS